jgi:hypothetical protein
VDGMKGVRDELLKSILDEFFFSQDIRAHEIIIKLEHFLQGFTKTVEKLGVEEVESLKARLSSK